MSKKLAKKYEEALIKVKEGQIRMADMKLRVKAIEQEYVQDVLNYKTNLAILVEYAKKNKLSGIAGEEGRLDFSIAAANEITPKKLHTFVMQETGDINVFFELVKTKITDTIKKYTEPLLLAEKVLKKKTDKFAKPKVT